MTRITASGSTRAILIVEDDEGLRRLITKRLRKAGFRVLEAGTGLEAMELVARHPDADLLLDQMLPDMEGRRLVDELRGRGACAPFIVMTGQGDERLAVEMMKLGAKDCLVKGLDMLDMIPAACPRLFREIDPALAVCLIGDEARVRQILFNVVGNALKYTQQGVVRLEMIPLSATPGNDLRILFSVFDTGIGIPANRLHDAFETFRQVDGSFDRQHQGAGLGLDIVRRLAWNCCAAMWPWKANQGRGRPCMWCCRSGFRSKASGSWSRLQQREEILSLFSCDVLHLESGGDAWRRRVDNFCKGWP